MGGSHRNERNYGVTDQYSNFPNMGEAAGRGFAD